MDPAANPGALAAELTEVADQLELLEAEVACLRGRLSRLALAAASAASAPASAPLAAAKALPRAGVSACNSKVKHYVVIEPAPGFLAGITKDYAIFAESVRDQAVPWSGRGRIAWHARAVGASFPTRGAAEAHYREQHELLPETTIPSLG